MWANALPQARCYRPCGLESNESLAALRLEFFIKLREITLYIGAREHFREFHNLPVGRYQSEKFIKVYFVEFISSVIFKYKFFDPELNIL
jgi:hypothetical protein